jgi:imidazolonepropionase-like amidohydrolase
VNLETVPADASRRTIAAAGGLWVEPGRMISGGWISMIDDRIEDLAAGEAPPLKNARFLDFSNLLVAPALIDAHVHLELNAGGNNRPLSRAQRAVTWGLAALRDGGGRGLAAIGAQARLNGKLTLLTTGAALHKPGRYGGFIGRAVGDEAEIKQAIADMADRGVDQIKVLASGPVNFDEFGRVGPPQFTEDELFFLVKTAADRGLTVMAHANGPKAAAGCLKAGVASIEHGYFMGRDNLAALARSQTVWTPTLAPMAALAGRETDPDRRRVIERTLQNQLDQVRIARDLGATIAAGSDAGCPGVAVGPGLYAELDWLGRAGLTVDQCLTAATAAPGAWPSRLLAGRPAVLVGFAQKNGSFDLSKPAAVFRGEPWAG